VVDQRVAEAIEPAALRQAAFSQKGSRGRRRCRMPNSSVGSVKMPNTRGANANAVAIHVIELQAGGVELGELGDHFAGELGLERTPDEVA